MMRGLVNGIGGTVMRVQGARTTEDAYAEAEKDNDKLRAEIDRLRAALVQIRGFVTVMGEHNWRDLRLHIERQCDALEQSEPPLVHVGRDGQPHNGPRAACTICFMWDQIASNEQDVNGIPCHEGTTCFNRECARLGCLLDREQR